MKFTDHFSPEKDIIKEKFTIIPYMDVWICSIVEGYIYKKIIKENVFGYEEEYVERYGKKEGECKEWYCRDDDLSENVQLRSQCYYKEGKKEGEEIWWHLNREIKGLLYYKDGKIEGEWKTWYENGILSEQCYCKDGKLDGEYKEWDEDGNLIFHKTYTAGESFEDLLHIQ